MHYIVNECEEYTLLQSMLDEYGYSVLKSRMSIDGCHEIIKFINSFPEDRSEINYGGSEKRIWGSHVYNSAVEEFGIFSDNLLSKVFGVQVNLKTVLSYSNTPIVNTEKLITGRWHLDSFRSQYKLFCFLTTTTPRSGPLELIPKTHKVDFKIRSLFLGKYFSLSGSAKITRQYQSLEDFWVQKQSIKFGGSVPVLCDGGSLVLVNTSIIHRARPCLEGNRYALCAYYGHF